MSHPVIQSRSQEQNNEAGYNTHAAYGAVDVYSTTVDETNSVAHHATLAQYNTQTGDFQNVYTGEY